MGKGSINTIEDHVDIRRTKESGHLLAEPFFLSFLGLPVGAVVKNLSANARDTEMWVHSLGQEDPLEGEMASYYIPGTVLALEIQSWREQNL